VQSFTARMPLLMAASSQVTENGAKKVTFSVSVQDIYNIHANT